MGKKSKSFLPKKIAGVKVPKKVRKGRFGELLASPAGQALLAEAIMAIGAVAGAKKVADSPEARDKISDVADAVRGAGKKAKRKAPAVSDAVAFALGEAARSFADALHRRGGDEHDVKASAESWSERHDSDDSKKKPISYEAGPL
jgi:hypothetical protein